MKKDTSEILPPAPRSKPQALELPARPPYIVGVNLQKLYLEATEMLAVPISEEEQHRDSSPGTPLEPPNPGAEERVSGWGWDGSMQ